MINKQLIPWLVRPNFKRQDGSDIDMPTCKLGGTDWKITKDVVSILKDAQSIGVKIPSQWAHEQLNIPMTDDDKALQPAGQGQPGQPPGRHHNAQVLVELRPVGLSDVFGVQEVLVAL